MPIWMRSQRLQEQQQLEQQQQYQHEMEVQHAAAIAAAQIEAEKAAEKAAAHRNILPSQSVPNLPPNNSADSSSTSPPNASSTVRGDSRVPWYSTMPAGMAPVLSARKNKYSDSSEDEDEPSVASEQTPTAGPPASALLGRDNSSNKIGSSDGSKKVGVDGKQEGRKISSDSTVDSDGEARVNSILEGNIILCI
jgi:hypothetical protein